MSPYTLAILSLLFGAIWWSFLHHLRRRKNSQKILPPGPWALPIIGNLHMIGMLPHRALEALSKKYGPIMLVQLGNIPTIVVSSPRVAELFLKTHDIVFASRPNIQTAKYLTYENKGMAFTTYGSYWRSVRKLCTLKLLSVGKIDGYGVMRREEMEALVRRLKVAAVAREVVDLSEKVEGVIEDMTCKMVFGRSSDERFDLKAVVQKSLVILGAFNIADFVPILAPFDLQERILIIVEYISSDKLEWRKRLERQTRVYFMVPQWYMPQHGNDLKMFWRKFNESSDYDIGDIRKLTHKLETTATLIIVSVHAVSTSHPYSSSSSPELKGEVICDADAVLEVSIAPTIIVDCDRFDVVAIDGVGGLVGGLFLRTLVDTRGGLTRSIKEASKANDTILEIIITEHEQDPARFHQTHDKKDFIDVMLSLMNNKSSKTTHDEPSYSIDRNNIKAIAVDMIVGAIDTSSTAIEWVMSEILTHPRVAQKIQQELMSVVGGERMVAETDLVKLEYLEMVIKETLRIHPVAPLLLPHESMEDIVIDGYFISKNSRVLVNSWAMGRDPCIWSDNVGEFLPERFINGHVDIRGRDFQLIPFGSGRRGCPGMHLGLTNIRLVVAHLMHCFDWKLPNGMKPNELNMSEKFGLSLPRAKHLLAIPTYRL
ncbi:hypothetical protein TEA_003284 [Camellia sinensis var. sinensis]|uniref:Uncharacterized protein n=1 Tax=Camellia sinensis var. sinensis TaxID=542762 RepID=A0A4S4DQB7_CAMSN|nr:hypothetical protein TEA_003284 [Camellia sinensis var. sinensis]